MPNIAVSRISGPLVKDLNIEFAERKGIGHPDTLIDGIVEDAGRRLAQEYIRKTGTIQHYNIDKGLIVGGRSSVGFGQGRIEKKIEVIVAGRARSRIDRSIIPVNDIVIEAARDYIESKTRFLDVERDVKFVSKLREGSLELRGLFAHAGTPHANDTAFGIGFAPLTPVEKLTLETEHYLNSDPCKKSAPEVGEDIKVLGVRKGKDISLTVAIAFVSKFIQNMEEYTHSKERITHDIVSRAKRIAGGNVDVKVNTGDEIEEGNIYLTATGLSCESGDDGAVGRGNRVNGLITPFRGMSLEAAAGKNPVSHIGKIYNVLARNVAEDCVAQYKGIAECKVAILGEIGARIDEPRIFQIEIGADKRAFESMRKKLAYIADYHLENLNELSIEITNGKYSLF